MGGPRRRGVPRCRPGVCCTEARAEVTHPSSGSLNCAAATCHVNVSPACPPALSSAGWFDNEAVALFPLVLSLALYLRALRTASLSAAVACALSLGYLARSGPSWTVHCTRRRLPHST